MNKLLKKMLIIVNLLLFGAFILSVFVPSHKKTVMYSNTDVNGSTNRDSISTVGKITNKRDITLSWDLYDQEFYGICLFFAVEGENENGEIICTLQLGEQEIARETILVKELFAKMKTSSLTATELFTGLREGGSGKYTLLLQGNGIPSKTKISLYGNTNVWKYVRIENDAFQEYYTPLYLLEVTGVKHPHIWSTAFILTLGLLFSYLIGIKDKEKRSEAIPEDEKV